MFKVLDEVQRLERAGHKLLHFELGEPDFNTPENISRAGCDAIANGIVFLISPSESYCYFIKMQQIFVY